MKIENPKTKKEISIYSAKLTFVKEKNGSIRPTVYVTILYNKNKKDVKNFPIPKDIDTDDLAWKRYKGRYGKGVIAIYHRDGDGDYAPKIGGIPVPTGLCDKLEILVLDTCFKNSNKKKRVK